jgi:hypothetical protein
MAIPQRTQVPVRVYNNGYTTAVAVGQRQRLYSGVSVRMFTWFYLSSINISG